MVLLSSSKDLSLTHWEVGWDRAGHRMCVLYSSGSNWVLTAAHCLHHPLDPEEPILHNSHLLSPSDFKIIMGESGPKSLKPAVVSGTESHCHNFQDSPLQTKEHLLAQINLTLCPGPIKN